MELVEVIAQEIHDAREDGRSIERIRVTPVAIVGTPSVEPFMDGDGLELAIHPFDWGALEEILEELDQLDDKCEITSVFALEVVR